MLSDNDCEMNVVKDCILDEIVDMVNRLVIDLEKSISLDVISVIPNVCDTDLINANNLELTSLKSKL